MKKSLWTILLIGIILRIILALITYHPDIQIFDLSGQILKKGNILNFYDYLYKLPTDSQMVKSFPASALNYPPAVYFLLGGVSLVLTAVTPSSVHQDFLFNTRNVLGNIFLNIHLLVLKLPYFVFDLGAAFLLYKFFDDPRKKLLAFTLWIFNPITLYATFMMGQFDIIPTFFVILALYIMKNAHLKKIWWATLFLGIGAAFKIYPLLFLVPLASLEKNWLNRLKIILGGLGIYFLTIIPFLNSVGFRTNALLANQLSKSFYAQIPISGGESIILFLFSVVLFYLIFLTNKEIIDTLWQRFFMIILLFFIFTHFHPQWFLWLTPFLILEMVTSHFKNILVLILALLSWLGMLFFFDSSLTFGLLAPIFPQLYQMMDVWHLLNINVDVNFFRSSLQSLLAVSGAFFIVNIFIKRSPAV